MRRRFPARRAGIAAVGARGLRRLPRPGNGLRPVARRASWRIPRHPGRAAHRYQRNRSRGGTPAAPGDPAGLRADPRVSGTSRDAGASAMRAGAARARIRAAPPDAAAVGLGGAAGTGASGAWPEDAPVRNGGAEPGAVGRSEPVGHPGGRACPGRRPASRISLTAPGDRRGVPAGRPGTPGCPSRPRIPGNGRWPRTAAGTGSGTFLRNASVWVETSS